MARRFCTEHENTEADTALAVLHELLDAPTVAHEVERSGHADELEDSIAAAKAEGRVEDEERQDEGTGEANRGAAESSMDTGEGISGPGSGRRSVTLRRGSGSACLDCRDGVFWRCLVYSVGIDC